VYGHEFGLLRFSDSTMKDKPKHLEGRFVAMNYISHNNLIITGSNDGQIQLFKPNMREDKITINNK